MAAFNKVILIGNLTRDPSLSYLPNTQTPVCEIGLAVNRRWRNRNGEQQEKVCFIDCKAFAGKAETLNQYLKKGQPLMIEGHLEFDRWEAPDGSTRSKHRVFIENFQFLGRGGDAQDNYQSAPKPAQQQPASNAPQNASPDYGDDGGMPSDDDIPF